MRVSKRKASNEIFAPAATPLQAMQHVPSNIVVLDLIAFTIHEDLLPKLYISCVTIKLPVIYHDDEVAVRLSANFICLRETSMLHQFIEVFVEMC